MELASNNESIIKSQVTQAENGGVFNTIAEQAIEKSVSDIKSNQLFPPFVKFLLFLYIGLFMLCFFGPSFFLRGLLWYVIILSFFSVVILFILGLVRGFTGKSFALVKTSIFFF